VGDAADLAAQLLGAGHERRHALRVHDRQDRDGGEDDDPTSARTGSVTNSRPSVVTSMRMTPTAKGNGAIGYQVASTSLLALDSSSPVEWSWCQARGSSR
jgi:hypothetical protein